MNYDPVEEDGYESPTGERDIPTCANFDTNTPVEQVLGFPMSKTAKVLNRKGRAICRIMASYGWKHAAIGRIFHVSSQSVSRAIANLKYTPRDRVEDDYDHIDPEYREQYPPAPGYYLPASQLRRTPSEELKPKVKRDLSEEHYDKLLKVDTTPPKRGAKAVCASRIKQTAESDSEEEGYEGRPATLVPQHRTLTPYAATDKYHRAGFLADSDDDDVSERGSPPVPHKRTLPPSATVHSKYDRAGFLSDDDDDHEHPTVPLVRRKRAAPIVPQKRTLPSYTAAQKSYHRNASEASTSKSARYAQSVWAGRARAPSSPHPRHSPEVSLSPPPAVALLTHPIPLPRRRRRPSTRPAHHNSSPPPSISLAPPAHTIPIPIPLPRRSLLPSPPYYTPSSTGTNISTLAVFLKTMCPDVDFSHHALLAALGFTVPRLHALAGWPTDALQEALGRVLSADGAAAVGCAPMTTFEALTFEIAVRALPQTNDESDSGDGNARTLTAFLRTAMGFDLSAHAPFLAAQGFTLATLGAMGTWDRERVKEVLGRGLGLRANEDGMRALEVVALEFAVCGRAEGI
ncbi:hypothetical protein C8R46DRAFT_1117416 [Mycena filopes]|nr:hypothetical protein C8R46DRAFT_1117416 [Mycena filopes]